TERLEAGEILAIKGIGGFHLLVDAGNEPAVSRLRQRKHREEKPLAIMVPDIEWARRLCFVGSAEEQILTSAQCPIVLLERRKTSQSEGFIAPAVAPDNPYLGV